MLIFLIEGKLWELEKPTKENNIHSRITSGLNQAEYVVIYLNFD